MKTHAQVVIIGGGVNGLGLAWRLAKAGITDIVVLESRYILYGASGRNGGGIRAQWATAENAELARESIRMFRNLSKEIGFNVWFRQSGYLFLAHDETVLGTLATNAKFHRSVGVKTRIVDPTEVSVLAPDVNTKGLTGASFCPTDGIIFPWSVVQGYWLAVKKMGVDVETFTKVTALEEKGGRIRRVHTDKGVIEAEWVVNAAGAWSKDVAAMAGVDLPNKAMRHEIFVTEAVKPFLDPMVVDMRNGMYANQDMRGEIVAGIGMPGEKPGINFKSSFGFTKRLAKALVDVLPVTADLRIMRQWAGAYDVTPDNKPVLGAVPGVANFLQLNGASGHGFMISPMTTLLTAEIILGRQPTVALEPFLVDRFQGGLEIARDAMSIG